jgi:hypothetical protein
MFFLLCGNVVESVNVVNVVKWPRGVGLGEGRALEDAILGWPGLAPGHPHIPTFSTFHTI